MRLHPGQAGRRVRHMFTVQQLKWNIISDLSRFKGALQIQLKVPIDRSSQIVWFNQQQSIWITNLFGFDKITGLMRVIEL